MNAVFLFLIVLLSLFRAPSVAAKYDPLSVPNNRFGIHIVDVNDLADAAHLVNSSGGDWGYVTLVIQDDDRNRDKWQGVFDQMRRLHLIPIVRIAGHIENGSWTIPTGDSDKDWARFLNSLNWPTENRYVILFNEPNHANEWGGKLDPEGFADTAAAFMRTLHNVSEDFFVMPGALDDSAASDGASMDAAVYLSRMVKKQPSLFAEADGMASHSYPNPAFSGSPFAAGKGSIASFRWQQAELSRLGVTKRLPVFITETGWIHSEGVQTNFSLLSSDRVGGNLKIAAGGVWNDPDIVAITPFVLNYQAYPFDHFSWRRLGSNEYYPQFAAYQEIPKSRGEPQQRERFTFSRRIIPESLVAGSTYTLSEKLTDQGQSILTREDNYGINLTIGGDFSLINDPLPILEPGQTGAVTLHLATPRAPGIYPYTLFLTHGSRSFTIEAGSVRIIPPPSVTVNVQMGWRKQNNSPDATILVYDNAELLRKVNGVVLKDGRGTVPDLYNIVPGRTYRIVVLLPYYLPRQTITKLTSGTTTVRMPRMLPLDFNRDGALTPADLWTVVSLKPNFITGLFIGP